MDDTVEIMRALNIYALGVDTQRWDLFDQVFTKDLEVTSPPAMRWTGLEDFKHGFAVLHAPLEASMHVMTNHMVVPNGDRARSLCYGQWRLIRKPESGGRDYWEGGGWYEDEWVRTPEGWRSKKRAIRITWWDGNPLAVPPVPTGPGWSEGMEEDHMSLCARRKAGLLPIVEELLALRKR
jgi:hypothetical protein